MLRIVFDVPRLKAKRRELEQISAQPEFWENQEEAKKQMLILDDVKEQLELLDKWKTFISDATASLELYYLEPEEEMILESQQGLNKLRENLDKWEFERLLCGETIRKEQWSLLTQVRVEQMPRIGLRYY